MTASPRNFSKQHLRAIRVSTRFGAIGLALVFATVTFAQQADPYEALGRQLDAAGAKIRGAAESGFMTGDEAWQAWFDAKEQIIADAISRGDISQAGAEMIHREIRKAELGERLGEAGAEIKRAYENGAMNGEEAKAAWDSAKHDLIDDAVATGTLTDAEALQYHNEIRKAEFGDELKTAGVKIKEAYNNGDLTGAEAKRVWAETKQAMIEEAVASGVISQDDIDRFDDQFRKRELGEQLEAAGNKIEQAAINGEMTEDEAWDAWYETKNRLIDDAYDQGIINEQEVEWFHREIEYIEYGDQLKSAVARGEMSEEEAWAAWEVYRADADRSAAENSAAHDRDESAGSRAAIGDVADATRRDSKGRIETVDDEWARFVRKFIERYQLNDEQQKRAWRAYRESRKRLSERLRRLDLDESDDEAALAALAKREREQLDRDYNRLFERLKSRLDKLPTAAQREAAKPDTTDRAEKQGD